MKTFTKVFDYILSRSIIFALSFVWCRFYIKELWLSAAAAIGITFVISFTLFLLSRAFKRRKAVSKAQNIHTEQVMTQFMYSTNRQNVEYFYNLVKNEYPATLLPECVLIENNKVKTLMFTKFKHAALTPDDIAEVFAECRRYNAQRSIIFCGNYSDKARETALRLGNAEIVLMNAENTYDFLKEFNMFPEIKIEMAQKKRKPLKVLLKFAFSRGKVKAYLWGGTIMLFCSFLVRYNLYYLISATVFLIFALISFINFKFKETDTKPLL